MSWPAQIKCVHVGSIRLYNISAQIFRAYISQQTLVHDSTRSSCLLGSPYLPWEGGGGGHDDKRWLWLEAKWWPNSEVKRIANLSIPTPLLTHSLNLLGSSYLHWEGGGGDGRRLWLEAKRWPHSEAKRLTNLSIPHSSPSSGGGGNCDPYSQLAWPKRRHQSLSGIHRVLAKDREKVFFSSPFHTYIFHKF